MTDENNLKVSDLPEQEQKALIAQAMEVGVRGVNLAGYKVETLKSKIAEKLAENGNGEEPEAEPEKEPEKAEVETAEAPEEPEAEPEKEPEVEKPVEKEKSENDLIPGEKIVKKNKKPVVDGICHICGSKVVNGVCSGCGFTR